MRALDDYIQQVKTLPPAPRIVVDLLALLLDDNAPADRVVELISFDTGLTTKVLQRCNSAAYGLTRRVNTVDEAVAHIGFDEIFRIVMSVVGNRTLNTPQIGYGIGPGELWQHSAVSAIAAQVIAHQVGENENLAFTAGLLHDIGKLVLGAALEQSYAAVLKEIGRSNRSFLEAEKALLGVDHAEVGGRLLSRWNFPEDLVQAVAHHHEPGQAASHTRLAACANLGDLLTHFLGFGHGHQSFAVRARREVLDLLQLTPPDLDALLLETEAAVRATPWFAPAPP